ncbi:MAG: hypothetical protein AAFV77_03775 [Planctomycetota bacterium]
MILMRVYGLWYLCTGFNRDTGSLGARCGAMMPHADGFEKRHPAAHYWRGIVPFDAARIEFYPTVSWQGHAVSLSHWVHTSSEPLLCCRIFELNASQERVPGRPDAPTPWDLEKQRIERLGWKYQARDGWHKACHVDELDKQAGPPPGIRA